MSTLPRSSVAIVLWGALAGCSSAAPAEPPPGPPEPFTVMSFNVLCSFCGGDEYDGWDDRLEAFDDVFQRYDPDLVGLQELALAGEVDQMLALLGPGYQATFYTNEDNAFSYPDATILYRTERFELLSRGEYWLSPTPEVPSSTGFADVQLPRLLQWVELKDKRSRRRLYFATTHVDNNTPSQEQSAPLILERTAPWQAKVPVLVVGDFNSKPASTAYGLWTGGAEGHPPIHDTFDLSEKQTVAHNQAVEPAYDTSLRIDHIFVAPRPTEWQVPSWVVDLHVYGPSDRYPSDHFAIYAELTAPEM